MKEQLQCGLLTKFEAQEHSYITIQRNQNTCLVAKSQEIH
jgi:hypothetical protein